MNNNIIGFVYLFTALAANVTSQLLIKWRVSNHIVSLLPLPDKIFDKFIFVLKILIDPFIFSACLLTLTGGLLWIATMTKMEISYAYPFTMLGFIAVLVLSVLLFGESMNIYKIIGCSIIVIGVLITSRGL